MRALHGDLAGAPDLVACPRVERDVIALLDWCGPASRRSSPTGAAAPWSAGWNRVSTLRRSPSTCAPLDRAARGRPGQPGGADPGRRVRAGAGGPAAPRTASPCATSRSPSSSRRSAAGSPPGRAGTTPPCTPHRRPRRVPARVTPAGVSESRRLPGSGPVRRRTGCSSARRGPSA